MDLDIVYLILLIAATILFGLAALNVASNKINLIAAGLFFWVLVPLIAQIKGLQ